MCSSDLVIFCAVGGRMSLIGAVYGTLLVNFGKTYFSESFPDLWLFLMAALFIGVTMAFPNGLAGLFESHIKPWWQRRRVQTPTAKDTVATTSAATVDTPKPAPTTPPAIPPGVSGQRA